MKQKSIPTNLTNAIDILNQEISENDKRYILENGSLSVHHTLGRWIRNNWGLWGNSELKQNIIKFTGFTHPDDMSNYIIEQFIKYLKN